MAELAEKGTAGILPPKLWLALGLLAVFPFVVRFFMNVFRRQLSGGTSSELLEAGQTGDRKPGGG